MTALWRLETRDSALVGISSYQNYTSKAAYVGYRHECATSWQKGVHVCLKSCRRAGLEIFRQPPSPDGKAVTSLQPLIESFTHPNAIVLDPFAGSGSTCVAALSPDAGISVSSCLNSITVPDSNDWPPCNGPCSRGPRMITGLNRRLRK